MPSFAVVLEYEGTRYSGSQIQSGRLTIQGEVEAALGRLTEEHIRIKAAGRTDAGVHARGQVAAFQTGARLSPDAVQKGLNRYLPGDIAVTRACQVREGFDPRREAVSREYRYVVLNSESRSPLLREFTCLVTKPLNVGAMREAAAVLIGRHDFASFTVDLADTRKSSVRTVYSAAVSRKGNLVLVDVVADSFLPHQVRRTVGALLRVGAGKMEVGAFRQLLEQKTPNLARPAAPARGLYLMKVNYDGDPAISCHSAVAPGYQEE